MISTYNGKQVALPFKSDYYVLYYNKDIFDAANVEYPSNDMTWDEWEEMCTKLTSGEGNNKVYGGYLLHGRHVWKTGQSRTAKTRLSARITAL